MPLLNEDGIINLAKGAVIYRSSDKFGGKTTLKYDYENLVIDSVKLMKDNVLVQKGDLSNLKDFCAQAGITGSDVMMRLAVEKDGEKCYIAWCDYLEMLEQEKT